MKNDQLGMIANAHLGISMPNVSDDKQLPITMPMELRIPNALVPLLNKSLLSTELSRLHSMAVDFPKTGERILYRFIN